MVHTVRNPETGEVLGFFPSVESVMLAAARAGWQNWVAECRHPTLAEMDAFFTDHRSPNIKPASELIRLWAKGEGNGDPQFDDSEGQVAADEGDAA
jgi:hypothetical protein